MSKRILCLLIVAALLVAGCADLPSFTAMRGSGNRVTQTYDFSNFDKLSISHAFETGWTTTWWTACVWSSAAIRSPSASIPTLR